MLGMTPTRYRAGGADEEIRFAVGQCSLGAILVASSRKGVAAILLGDDPDALVRDLQDRFPKARLIGGDRDYEALVARVVGLVEAPGRRPRPAARRARHRVPAARLAGPAGHPGRPDRHLCRDRPADRLAQGGARGRRRLRRQQHRRRNPLPPRGAQRRRALRLRLGRRAQARADREGGRGDERASRTFPLPHAAQSAAARVARYDWAVLAAGTRAAMAAR